MSQVGHLDIPTIHGDKLNDIWGYVDEYGTEYALVGAENGVSIVDLSDPTNPVEVTFLIGPESVWRDLKTYGDYAYITTEADAGLWIVDLSPLPESSVLPVNTYNGPPGFEWTSAHNVYQDDGYVYIFGANRDAGGVIILDVATDPWNPIEVGKFENWYCHDGFVRNDTGYFAHIYDGHLSIVDLSDKSSPVLLGQATTPTNFCHNIWASESGDAVFTTDETSGGYLASFDITNVSSIVELDRIQSSPGEGRIPHNAHVKGNYLYTSYYNDGVVIHDISNPSNMVEVANFDTSPLWASTTFNGCWGAYPYLPSGLILAADREEGLFVLDVEEHPASYLEGHITEMGTGIDLNNVEITIDGETVIDWSNVFGMYKTGIEGEGTVDVTYHKVYYYDQTIPVTFANGVVTTQDVVMEKIPLYNITVEVLDAATLAPIEGADVLVEHSLLNETGLTDASGQLVVDMYYEDNYQIYAGKWGYDVACINDTLIDNSATTITVYLNQGIYDDFTFDNGWVSGGVADRGHWEREIPVGVIGGSDLQNPDKDAPWDCGEYAWITGNGTLATNTQEVNNGQVVLYSPAFDLSTYPEAYINYQTFFFNKHGATPDDTLMISITNGPDLVTIHKVFKTDSTMSKWIPSSIRIDDKIALTSTMQVILTLSDYPSSENVTEAAFDHFSITDYSMSSIPEPESVSRVVKVYPNPTDGVLNVVTDIEAQVAIYDLRGQLVIQENNVDPISLEVLESGVYVLMVTDLNGNQLHSQKVIKR